jgi:hypothetical protein
VISPRRDAAAVAAPRVRRPRLLGELLIVFVLLRVYDYVRSFADARQGRALTHGRDVLDVERFLHIDIERAMNHWVERHDFLAIAAVDWYQYVHISATMSVLVWCYIAGPGLYRGARNALVATNLVGMTVYFFLPVMPPRLLPGEDYIDSVAAAGFGTTHGGPVTADQFGAMPSLHLAWATWTALVAFALLRRYPRARFLVVLYPTTTALVVMATANHFAGVAVALAARRALPGPLPVRTTVQMILRRSSTASTNAPGTSGSQTVISRYPTTAPSAAGDGTPAQISPATSTTSSPPIPPGDGSRADTEETTT